jgi:ribosomal protein L11 methyltransferase
MTVPYQTLYIYEISGKVQGSRTFFREDFIGCWNEGEVSFLFFSSPRDQEVEAFIQRKRFSLLSRNVLDYKAWQAGEELKPFKVGNLIFSPPWENREVGNGEGLIQIDPCVVFGTGYHFTTRSCLQALHEIYQKETPEVVLDLGTGSGILALAAAKWGAERVLAIDCNELAVDTALRNVSSNKESERIEVKLGGAEDFIKEEAELVCANLPSQVIDSLLKKDSFYQKRWFILSGFFAKDAKEIEERLNQKSIETYRRLRESNWVTLVGLKRSPEKDSTLP